MDRTIALSSAARRLPARTTLNGIYEIDEFIADGGMGEVYRGHNIQTGDMVAIKTILPELASHPDALALFRNEASTLNRLNHEGIVRYFTFAVDPQLQRAYLAMEYVSGPSLASRIEQGPLQLETVRHLARRLAGALAAAHAYGVVHRDISPDNVILSGGDVRQAKLIDFGIAKSTAVGERTIIGNSFAGKHGYASPEQLGLAGGRVGPKSDVYSLGLLLAEALTGRPVGKGITEEEVIAKRRRVPELAEADPALRPLLQAMLHPDPDKRPAMADVAEWQGGAAAKSRFDAPLPAAGGRRRGRRLLYHLFGTVLPLVLGGGAAVAFYAGAFETVIPRPEFVAGDPFAGRFTTPADCPPPTGVAGPPPAEGSVEYYIAAINASLRAAGLAPLSVDCPTVVADAGGTQPTGTTPGTTLPGPNQGQPAGPGNGTVVAPQQANRAPSAPVSATTLGAGVVGRSYAVFLPPFADEDVSALVLTTEGTLPPGLRLVNRGGGSSTLEGTPTAAGTFSFALVATDPAGLSGRVQVTVTIAPATTPGPGPADSGVQTPAAPAASAAEVVARFDGGTCFHAVLEDGRLVGYGTNRGPLDTLAGNVAAVTGTTPATQFHAVTQAQCPAVALAAAARGAPAPAVRPDAALVPAGGNLSASITGLDGRLFRILLVSDTGSVVDITGTPFVTLSGQTAAGARFTFGPVNRDAASTSSQRIILVVAADRIPASLVTPGPNLLQALAADLAAGGVGVGIAAFSIGN